MQNWNKKPGENFLFGRSHSYVDRDLQKKRVFTLFSNQLAARGFNSFSKSGPSCEIIAHPCSRSRQPNKVIFSARLSIAFCSEGFGVPPERLVSTEDKIICYDGFITPTVEMSFEWIGIRIHEVFLSVG